MAIIRRKTKKKLGKQVKKLVKQHGPEVALGAATALVTTLINKATDKSAKKDKGEKDKGKKDKKAKTSSKGDASRGGSSKGDGKKSKKAQAES